MSVSKYRVGKFLGIRVSLASALNPTPKIFVGKTEGTTDDTYNHLHIVPIGELYSF